MKKIIDYKSYFECYRKGTYQQGLKIKSCWCGQKVIVVRNVPLSPYYKGMPEIKLGLTGVITNFVFTTTQDKVNGHGIDMAEIDKKQFIPLADLEFYGEKYFLLKTFHQITKRAQMFAETVQEFLAR